MSFNANTLYPAVDINVIAKQCGPKPTTVFIVVDDWGYVNSVYKDKDAAESCASCANKINQFNEDCWIVQEFELR